MATNIGRVGMVMKGDYNSASTYETLDAVTYQNGLYIAKQNVPAGTVPTNTTYWQAATNTNNNPKVISLTAMGDSNIQSVITFSGTGITRRGHYILICCGQNDVGKPIAIALRGSGGNVSGVTISDDEGGYVGVENSSVIINNGFGGKWGGYILIDLLPYDTVTITETTRTTP